MGRKAGIVGGQSGASRGRDQIPERSVPSPQVPSPTRACRSSHQEGKHVSFSWWPWPWPILSPAPPTPCHSTHPPAQLFGGVCLCHSSRVSNSLAHQDTAWVRKDLRRLKKWVESGSHCPCVLSAAVANWQQGRVADVREDKGRHGPHQPPITAGLCQPG